MLLNNTKKKQILVGRWGSWNPCSNPDDEIVKWYNCYGKQYESTSKNKTTNDSAIPLLNRYPKELKAGYLHTYTENSISYNSQELESTQMSIKR